MAWPRYLAAAALLVALRAATATSVAMATCIATASLMATAACASELAAVGQPRPAVESATDGATHSTAASEVEPSPICRVESESSSGPGWTMRLEYPAFPSLPGPEAMLRAFVDASRAEFEASSEANDLARAATASPEEKVLPRPPHEMIIEWKAASLGPRWLSLEVHRYWWVGGAHGEDALLSINYDIGSDRFLTLGDILSPAASSAMPPAAASATSSLEAVAAFARADLLRRFASTPGIAPWIESGTAPNSANYECFTFDEKTITIHFAKYQVGPGSAGLVDVVLPRDPES